MNRKTTTFIIAITLGITFPGSTLLAETSDLSEKIKQALNMPHRSDENRARDANRNPVKAMEYCRLHGDMAVLEFGPGNGWYTEILGPVLNQSGSLTIAYNGEWMEKLDPLLTEEFMSKVSKHPIDIGWNSEEKRFDVGDITYQIEAVDLALNIREYHNFNAQGAAIVNQATYDALKPGGYYCVIDHTRRHMQPYTNENRRRADPVTVIMQIQAAGFKLIDSSDLFYKADDELRYEVGRKSVTGNTDRFSLLFQKPDDVD